MSDLPWVHKSIRTNVRRAGRCHRGPSFLPLSGNVPLWDENALAVKGCLLLQLSRRRCSLAARSMVWLYYACHREQK